MQHGSLGIYMYGYRTDTQVPTGNLGIVIKYTIFSFCIYGLSGRGEEEVSSIS